mmetsp:Transcript_29799/g.69516  ORF Transcript_29799/g.69516 Transcript_29799/m.69516 type:complete len:203 (-) Transcript_29799:147-755(-)
MQLALVAAAAAELDTTGGCWLGCCGCYPILDVTGDREEGGLHIDVVLCGRFKELEAVLIRQFLPLLSANSTRVREAAAGVRLVTEQHLVDRVGGVLLYGAHPPADAFEGRLARHVVHEQDSHRAAVVRRRDGPKPLLPGGVPNLQLDLLVVEGDCADLEIDPDRRDERLREGVVRKASEDGALANTRVADEKKLDQEVVLLV